MRVYKWLGKDEYNWFICCTEEETMDIVSKFGSEAKGFPITELVKAPEPEFRKNYGFVLNTKKKTITPIKNSVWISHPDWWDPLVGKERKKTVDLDGYRLYDRMYP